MAQKGFPENPGVGDTFKKDGKTYIFQGDKWVIKDDFTGPDPGTKNGQEWTNIRTDKTYTWDAATKTWGEKGATTTTAAPKKTTTTTTAPPKKTPTTTAAPTTTVKPKKSSPSTTVPVTTTTVPVTTTTVPVTTTTVPETIPGDPSSITKDYESDYLDAKNMAYGLLTQQSQVQRIEFLNLLYAKGFGSGAKPTSGGLEPSDIDMAAQFYVYYRGNSKTTDNPDGIYKTVNDAYGDIKKWKTVATAGASTFTPKLDVATAFRQVMQNDLGRAPTDQEVERFYSAYRGMESGGDAPNLQSAAESQIAKTMTGESQAASFSNYADVFEQLMRGA